MQKRSENQVDDKTKAARADGEDEKEDGEIKGANFNSAHTAVYYTKHAQERYYCRKILGEGSCIHPKIANSPIKKAFKRNLFFIYYTPRFVAGFVPFLLAIIYPCPNLAKWKMKPPH